MAEIPVAVIPVAAASSRRAAAHPSAPVAAWRCAEEAMSGERRGEQQWQGVR
jgi:hypothetical protein